MNNTIFTREIVLGTLIALVLAFGVQGVADAATATVTKRTGDLEIKPLVTNQTFEFSFTVGGVPYSRPDTDATTADDERESITITPSGGSIVEVSMGSTRYSSLSIASGSDFTLTEWHTDSTNGTLTTTDDTSEPNGTTTGDLTSGTVTVKVDPGTDVGSITVTVTAASGVGGGSTGDFDPITFTAYAVRPFATVQSLRFAATPDDQSVNPTTKTVQPSFDPTNPIYDEVVSVTVEDIGATDNHSWALVGFEVIEGPGYVYEDLNDDSMPDTAADRNSKSTSTLTRIDTATPSVTANIARVRLRLNGGTNKIRATITNVFPAQTYEITYLFQGTGTTPGTPPPTGNSLSMTLSSSTATAGSSINVTVNANRTSVSFRLSGSSGLTVLENGVMGTPISVRIPRNTRTGQYTLRATATGYNTESRDITVRGTQTNVTPQPSRSSISGAQGAVIPVNVTLSNAPDGTIVTIEGPFHSSGRVTANTISSVARFRLRLLPDSGSGTANITASSYTSRVGSLDWTVTGSAPTTGTQVRLGLASGASSQLSGTAGSNVQLQVRVTNTAGAAVPGVAVTFRSNNADLATHTSGTNGVISVNYTVQTTAQTVTARINDTNVDSTGASQVTFTITPGTPQQSTRLNIFQTTNTGAPGAPHALTILMTTQSGAAAVNQVVILTTRNAARAVQGTPTTLFTGNDGRATTDTFSLPTTPGTYTITATSGTETRSITVTVVAIRLVKDASDSVSGDNQDGDRGQVLDNPFVLKVVQDVANVDPPVQGVPVTFTIVDGDGELSTSSSATSGSTSLTVRSDTNGDVRAYLVLGEDDEDNRVRASVGITGVTDVFFDATGVLVPEDIVIVSGNNQRGTPNRYIANPFVVRVTDENGDVLQGVTVTFSLRGPGGTLSPRSAETDRNGEAEAELLPRTAGTYFITASVTGVTSVRFTVTVGDLADSIEIVSGDNQSGEPGTELEDPLVVEVLDENDSAVSGVTVSFSVAAGGGSLSATSVTTNSRGRAQTDLTLGDDPGRNSVRASVSGVSQRVTFTATAEDPAPPEPDIRLPAGQRADTYWINTETGTIHRLVGNNVEDIAPSVQNVVSFVATNNRLFWVEKTSNSSGRIRRSNLNGGNIQLIRSLSTAPAGITIDTVNAKIYVTTERGKIQSINVDGSQYEPNLIVGLDTPADIAIDMGSGKLFWITERGTVHYANVDGSGETQFASGYNTLGSIAVGAGKVFWTEETTGSAGKIHSANLNGRNITELVSLGAAPYGISVDAAGKKLYWTNSRGKIMQSNLSGKSPKAVVADLVSLGDISVPAGTTPTRPPGTFSKYDVNKDGVVDNTDAALVADALGETNPDNARLDVNGDGRVNFLDLLLVFDNRDDANAPPVSVAKHPKVSREEVQKQIDLLIASNNDSLTAQHTLTYLQSLLEVVSPERTRLLANYPNPFNPETWIPYQLATDSEVQITIYNTTGNVVRTLKLGHQSEGYYTDRSRAAYWDGRNGIGEQVASGIYFYVFTANEFSATRKMLILK